MAALHNQARSLRLLVEWVETERVSSVPPGFATLPSVSSPRVLGAASIEFFDRRDSAFWPFVRLPVVYFGAGDGQALVASLRGLCSGRVPGVTFRGGTVGEVVLQVAPSPGEAGFEVEAGFDLGPYLFESAGQPIEPRKDLALFRFSTDTAELVRFADQVKEELAQLSVPGVST